MKKVLTSILTAVLLLTAGQSVLFGQKKSDYTISGKVTDAQTGETLPGTSVFIQGTTLGAYTDEAGSYILTVPASKVDANTEVTFSAIGYKDMIIKWNGKKAVVNIELTPDAEFLEELVVVGYGTQKKSDITGAVASVNQKALDQPSVTSLSQVLQGAVAGLNFSTTTASANPDSDNMMLIRGSNSISASNAPLLILDGVPFSGSLAEISPRDIKSVEILKDASSAAIYGSRAANGIILITTRQGAKGKTRVNYETYYSLREVSNFPNLMNTDQYLAYQLLKKGSGSAEYDEDDPSTWGISDYEIETYNMMKNGTYPNYTWADLILRRGSSQKHSLSVSGGSDRTTFNVSGNYVDTKGIVNGDDYRKFNGRANLNINVSKNITFQTINSLTYENASGQTPSWVNAFNKSPLYRPFNEDGTINIYPAGSDDTKKINPLETSLYDDMNHTYSATTTNSLNIKLPFVQGLSYKFTFAAQYKNKDAATYKPLTTQEGANGYATTSNTLKYGLLAENLLSYDRTFAKKHHVFLTGLFGFEESVQKGQTLEATGFESDFLSWYGASQAAFQQSGFTYSKSDLVSQMLRANYTFDSRYSLTYTVRRDGASVFGADTKYGVFQSAAFAWNIANEPFWKPIKKVMNVFKLRMSYGENGNQAIKPYETIAQMNNNNPVSSSSSSDYVNAGNPAPGYVPTTLGMPQLSWETTRSLNLGVDFAFFNDRINGDVNIYRNNTEDLLLSRTISGIHGINKITQNIGKTSNEGIELTLNTVNVSNKDFQWSTNFTMSYNRNTIVDLYGDGNDDVENGWFIGKPIKVNYDYWIIGTWQTDEAALAAKYGAQPGYAKYDDYNRDGTYDDVNDRQFLGTPVPTTIMGLTNTFSYRNLSLSVFLYGAFGAMKSNCYYDNTWYVVRDFWSETNPTNAFWSVDNYANAYANGKKAKPKKYESADYLRVKDITLSYKLPERWATAIKSSNINIYATAKNPWTVTKFGGLDPELEDGRNTPMCKEFLLGLNISF